MPADFLINIEQNIVFSYGWGTLTYEDIQDHRRRLWEDASFKREFRQIAMLSDVSEMKFSNNEISTLASQPVFAARSQRAIVANGSPHFGLARVFDGYSEGQVIQVFRLLEEAAAWLNMPIEVTIKAFEEIRHKHGLA